EIDMFRRYMSLLHYQRCTELIFHSSLAIHLLHLQYLYKLAYYLKKNMVVTHHKAMFAFIWVARGTRTILPYFGKTYYKSCIEGISMHFIILALESITFKTVNTKHLIHRLSLNFGAIYLHELCIMYIHFIDITSLCVSITHTFLTQVILGENKEVVHKHSITHCHISFAIDAMKFGDHLYTYTKHGEDGDVFIILIDKFYTLMILQYIVSISSASRCLA
ncbi:hypothetical protein ACJX0J_033163, partial [Zea mays]